MPDENSMKSIVSMQNKLQPYMDAMEDTWRHLQPMQDAIRLAKEQSLGIEKMPKNIDLFSGHTALLKDFELNRQMIEIQARFELPKMPEISHLISGIHAGAVSEAMANFMKVPSGLQQALESMHEPWLDINEKMRSLTSFTELQSIGRALDSIPSFDDSLAAALRFDLGDWRDIISWKPAIFEDWEARSDFYESLGFNKALTDFPVPAFEQSLDIAELRRKPPTLVAMYGSPVPTTDKEDEEALTRTNRAHDWLLRLETQFRAFIDKEMTKAFGANWPKHRLPNGIYDKWQQKKKDAIAADGKEMPMISYADFTDYELVICRSDNWRTVFTAFKAFGNPCKDYIR
jgi:hypothetical protein